MTNANDQPSTNNEYMITINYARYINESPGHSTDRILYRYCPFNSLHLFTIVKQIKTSLLLHTYQL